MLMLVATSAQAQGYTENDEIQQAINSAETTTSANYGTGSVTVNNGTYGTAPTIIYQTEPVKKPVTMRGRHIERVDRSELKAMFIPKGQWMFGGSISFNEWDASNTNFLVVKDMDFKGHTFGVTPVVGWAPAKNLIIGGRFKYNRNYFNLGNLGVNLGGVDISLDHLYYLEHTFEGGAFLRAYTPIAGSKILAMFSEVQLNYGYSKGKNTTGTVENGNFDGTFDHTQYIQLGFSPGICCFVTDFMAVEVGVNVVGLKYRWSDQTTNKVETGSVKQGSANFKVNLFSINIGMCVYL